MRKKPSVLILSFFVMLLCLSIAHASTEEALVHITHLEKSIYRITYTLPYTFVHLASIGKDGTFLIDAGAESTAQELLHALRKIRNNETTFVLSTHAHQDHIGGNPKFEGEAVIFAHINAKKRYAPPEYSPPGKKRVRPRSRSRTP